MIVATITPASYDRLRSDASRSTHEGGLEIAGVHAFFERGRTALQLASGGKFKFAGNFSIASNPLLIKTGQETTFTITAKATAKVKSITDFESEAGAFKFNSEEEALCIKTYAIGEACHFKAKPSAPAVKVDWCSPSKMKMA